MTTRPPIFPSADPPASNAGGGSTDPISQSEADALQDAAKSLADLADAVSATASVPPPPSAKPTIISGGDRPVSGEPTNFELPSFDAAAAPAATKAIDLLADVNLNVKIELGRTRMLVSDVLRLAEGSVVELDKLAGDPVDIYVNDRPIARGEVLVLNENFCVRINEILAQQPEGQTPAE
ncbi:MAG: hypothetical protein AMXMBFR58_09790 [Phycisphaerae bacterium]